MDKFQTKDVFGIQRDIPLNYIEREADKIFIDSLDRGHHIVIFGSSKQGKTCLRKKNLNDKDYITVHCDNKMDLYNLNINILKQAGFTVQISETKTISGKAKIRVGFGWNLFGKADFDSELEGEKGNEKEYKPLELDPEDINDIIKALNSLDFNKYIVIEDFHYLKDETQVDFAIELKAFHENSKFTFIIVGVWLEENRLIALNGDLSGRVKSVNADEWTDQNLLDLIATGEELLNITIPENEKIKLIEKSLNNVYIVQEVCYEISIENGIKEQSDQTVLINCTNLENIISKVISQHSGRYNNLLTNISEGFQSTELEMHKWIMYAILKSDIEKLEIGLKRNEINILLQAEHPKKQDLNPGNLTQALKSIASLQVKKNTIPIIIDYDSSNLKLNIVDKGFLIWLSDQDKDELITEIGL
ncbi:hypothetical protein HX004_02040 [Myroides sp. 1354]|uniref:hypothetical protein n=1 Tax=unclassified Myroides TaxID=2642485 RepID=UPI0025778722|nr:MULTISPECIES: hypothetical protein [unclassified Myroides]MDM1043380.1 hypothetical protein [Myroides sp. R163-1]MDM1054569.1 hypothetical protein [Myroides sp. 1354]MDM1067866.1 hypothetical protein [Myroides sp. 1372]